ncbi:MAG: metallopeptidase TldD-related protein [Anaerolineaceae bacterium]|nr:metallopeptidase TldD-related protein [Anaerolineaceae bacterium]
MNSSIDTLKKAASSVLAEIEAKGIETGECTLNQNTLTEVYYEGAKISMIRSCLADHGKLKILKEQRKGENDLTDFSNATISDAVNMALKASEVSQLDAAEEVSEETENKDFVFGPQQADKESMLQTQQELLKTLKKEYPSIVFDGFSISHELENRVYANSKGVLLSEQHGVYTFQGMMVAREGQKTTSFDFISGAFKDFDKPLIERDGVRRKFENTVKLLDTQVLEGHFEGDLILPPNMLEEILWYVQMGFLSDRSLISGISIWKDKLGSQVAVPGFNLSLDPANEALAATSLLTPDGYLANEQKLIEGGNLTSFSLSRYGAAKTGGMRAGNASQNFILAAGSANTDEMIASVKHGLLLNRFSGGMPSAAGDLTGVAKNSFLIENGRIAYPVTETMISTNIAQMLLSIEALSSVRENNGSRILPWAKVSGVTISGK